MEARMGPTHGVQPTEKAIPASRAPNEPLGARNGSALCSRSRKPTLNVHVQGRFSGTWAQGAAVPNAQRFVGSPAGRDGFLGGLDAVRRAHSGFHLYLGCILSLIHISEPTRRTPISYAVFC